MDHHHGYLTRNLTNSGLHNYRANHWQRPCIFTPYTPDRPTPKSDESWGRVNPLVVAIRTASRRNSSVYIFAIPYLLHSKHCSKKTGTKP